MRRLDLWFKLYPSDMYYSRAYYHRALMLKPGVSYYDFGVICSNACSSIVACCDRVQVRSS